MPYDVTIGIPVFNVEKYIRLTLDSVLAQTYPSIEILVCDDCSTDASADIVRQYQQESPRGKDIRILRQAQNMGIGAARNRMIAEATGRFFYSLDGDDAISPNAIELLVRAAEQHGAQIVYGSFERVFMYDGVETGRKQFHYPSRVFTQPDEYAMYAYYNDVQGMNWNYLIDIGVIRKNSLKVVPVKHGYGEDFTFTVDLPTYLTRAVLLPDVTYHYYNRTSSGPPKPPKVLQREQFLLSIEAIEQKKQRRELRHKPYYARRCSRLMMFDCSFACRMVCCKDSFDVPFTLREVRQVMRHPMTLGEILKAGSDRVLNLFYYMIGKLPPSLCALALRMVARKYGI